MHQHTQFSYVFVFCSCCFQCLDMLFNMCSCFLFLLTYPKRRTFLSKSMESLSVSEMFLIIMPNRGVLIILMCSLLRNCPTKRNKMRMIKTPLFGIFIEKISETRKDSMYLLKNIRLFG